MDRLIFLSIKIKKVIKRIVWIKILKLIWTGGVNFSAAITLQVEIDMARMTCIHTMDRLSFLLIKIELVVEGILRIKIMWVRVAKVLKTSVLVCYYISIC